MRKPTSVARVGASAAAIAFMMSAAGAADVAVRMPVKALGAPAAYDWTGFYLGVNAGYGVGRNPSTAPFTFGPPQIIQGVVLENTWTQNPTGWVGGGQIGYNWQAANWLLGLEADIQASEQDDSVCLQGPTPCTVGLNIDQSIHWFGTVRGRVGYVNGPVLVYATGGWAIANVETNYSSGIPLGSVRENLSGWTVGGGVEAALGGPWTAKIEYLYMDLGNVAIGPVGVGLGVSTGYFGEVRNHVGRVGLNYRWGATSSGAPASAWMLPQHDWTGFYVGVNAGYGAGHNPTSATLTDTTVLASVNDRWNMSPGGGFGGAQIGYNRQVASWVFGLEFDIQASAQRDTACGLACVPLSLAAVTTVARTTFEQDISWFGTLRGRAGYAAGPALFYATGGLAYARVNTNITEVLAGGGVTEVTTAQDESNKFGWTVGAGIEAAIAANWSVKVEYLYMDLGDVSLSYSSVGGLLAHTFDSSITNHIARVGLNYKFGGPVRAAY